MIRKDRMNTVDCMRAADFCATRWQKRVHPAVRDFVRDFGLREQFQFNNFVDIHSGDALSGNCHLGIDEWHQNGYQTAKGQKLLHTSSNLFVAIYDFKSACAANCTSVMAAGARIAENL